MQEFLGFTLFNQHFGEAGDFNEGYKINRISTSDRYHFPVVEQNANILHLPKQQGSYFLNNTYNSRTISFEVSVDDMSLYFFTQFQQLLNSYNITKIIFDETNYKYDYVQISNCDYNIWYIDKSLQNFGDEIRVAVRGFVTINLECIEPYSRSVDTDEYLEV